MHHSLAKELKDAGFPQDGKNCETYAEINDSALVDRLYVPPSPNSLRHVRSNWAPRPLSQALPTRAKLGLRVTSILVPIDVPN